MIGKKVEIKCWKQTKDIKGKNITETYLQTGIILDKLRVYDIIEHNTASGYNSSIAMWDEYFVKYDSGNLESVHPERIEQVH